MGRTSQLCYHRGSGQGYVTDESTRQYLGVWSGGPAAAPPQAILDAYRAFLAVRLTLLTTKRAPIEGLCVAEVAAAFLEWAKNEYKCRSLLQQQKDSFITRLLDGP